MPLRDVFVTLVVFGLLPVILVRPFVGILLWSWIGFMNPHRLTWSFAYGFPWAALVGMATLLGILLARNEGRMSWNRETVTLLLLSIWVTFTTVLALYPDAAWEQWDKVIKILFMTLVTIYLLTSRERITALVWVVVLSIGFYGVKGGIFTLLGGAQNMVLGPPGTFISGNTEIGLAMIMVLPLMRFLQLQAADPRIRWGLGVMMVLTGLAILGTYSRGAFLAVGAVGVFLLLKSRRKALIGAAALMLVPLALAFLPGQWYEQMETIQNYRQDPSSMGRINAWRFALNLVKDHPVTGGGFETFEPGLFVRYAPDPEDFHDAHSIYFEILGEHGLVGLTLFLALLAFTWRSGSRLIRLAKERPELTWARDLAAMLHVSLVGYAVGGAFLGLAYFDLYYTFVAFIVAAKVLVEPGGAREEETAGKARTRARWPGGTSASGLAAGSTGGRQDA